MITGDNKQTAQAVADELGIDTVLAGVLPDRKSEEIERLQVGTRCGQRWLATGSMTRPRLAQADVGIAIGAGTDVAIESADAVLVQDNLEAAVGAIELSRRTMQTIRQNLFWAFGYNVVAIPLAAGASLPLDGLAAVADHRLRGDGVVEYFGRDEQPAAQGISAERVSAKSTYGVVPRMQEAIALGRRLRTSRRIRSARSAQAQLSLLRRPA